MVQYKTFRQLFEKYIVTWRGVPKIREAKIDKPSMTAIEIIDKDTGAVKEYIVPYTISEFDKDTKLLLKVVNELLEDFDKEVSKWKPTKRYKIFNPFL